MFRGISVLALVVLLSGCATPRTSSFQSPFERRLRQPANLGVRPRMTGSTLISWPTTKGTRVTRGYNLRSRRPHHGLDIRGSFGTPIRAAHRGRVIYTGQGYRGYGKLIIIDDGSGWSSFYAHLSKFHVNEGDFVQRGDVVASMGSTGRATGVHLHFELRKNKVPVDPLGYLP